VSAMESLRLELVLLLVALVAFENVYGFFGSSFCQDNYGETYCIGVKVRRQCGRWNTKKNCAKSCGFCSGTGGSGSGQWSSWSKCDDSMGRCMRERSKRTCYGPNTCMNEEEHETCQQSECGGETITPSIAECKVTKERDGGCLTYDQHKLIESNKPIILYPKGNLKRCEEKCVDSTYCDGFVALKDGSKCWLVAEGCGKKGGQKDKYDFYRKQWHSGYCPIH